MNIKLITILCFALLKMCFSACRDSYVITCDSVSDFERHKNIAWTEVLIVGDNLNEKSEFDVGLFFYLNALTVVGQFNGIRGYTIHSLPTSLKFLNLYDNEFRNIKKEDLFYRCYFEKLSLKKNKIESIESRTFTKCQPKEIDLSDNNLKVIEEFTFNDPDGENSIKTINIQRNKLEYIYPDSFPPSLEMLRLEDNRLTFIADKTFSTLRNLRLLDVSRNSLYQLSDLTPLRNLMVLDFSHNFLTDVRNGTFRNSTGLMILNLSHNRITQMNDAFDLMEYNKFKLLDLSHNKLESVKFLPPLLKNRSSEHMTVSLAFNLLNDFDFNLKSIKSITYMRLILYGNPWKCRGWINIERSIEKKYYLEHHGCDDKFFNKGLYPFCVGSALFPSFYPNDTNYNIPFEEYEFVDYEHFFKAVNDNVADHTRECRNEIETNVFDVGLELKLFS